MQDTHRFAAQLIPVHKIVPNPYQPRSVASAMDIRDLAESIRKVGLLHPIVVRPIGKDRYQIVAGERRYRAALTLGWDKISAHIIDADTRTLNMLALEENAKRKAVSPLETAAFIARSLAQTVGIDFLESLTHLSRLRKNAVPPDIRLE